MDTTREMAGVIGFDPSFHPNTSQLACVGLPGIGLAAPCRALASFAPASLSARFHFHRNEPMDFPYPKHPRVKSGFDQEVVIDTFCALIGCPEAIRRSIQHCGLGLPANEAVPHAK